MNIYNKKGILIIIVNFIFIIKQIAYGKEMQARRYDRLDKE